MTWRLEPEGKGTRLFLEHDGFDPDNPHQQLSGRFMTGGWLGTLRRLAETVTAERQP